MYRAGMHIISCVHVYRLVQNVCPVVRYLHMHSPTTHSLSLSLSRSLSLSLSHFLSSPPPPPPPPPHTLLCFRLETTHRSCHKELRIWRTILVPRIHTTALGILTTPKERVPVSYTPSVPPHVLFVFTWNCISYY